MEKEYQENTYGNDNIGSVKIADDVVATIAGIAAAEVEGVAAMAGNLTNGLLDKVGVKNLKKGVRVEVIGREVRVDMALVMEYGYNIPASSRKVQERVQNAIENMTGLEVTDVNIRIMGINMQKNG
ncbi:MAG: Asp23/Gls24 family envelope stress response protein [Lachnospiraceae bacterium]|nr:Asp23/Gls24 family envelope stress response protein [Lachnospiraceae bacterium]